MDDNMNNEMLVVLGEYPSDIDANIVKGVLETNGVRCIITNEIISSLLPIASLSPDMVRVMVFERDLDEARRILASAPIDDDGNQQ